MNEYEFIKKQIDLDTQSKSVLQEESADRQERLVAPQLREQIAETQAAIIAQTNPARALKIILNGFRGYILNEDGDYELIGIAIMNEGGIARLASILIPFVNDPVRFGKISYGEVRSLSLRIVNDITEEVGIHWREFGIKNPSVKNLIVDACLVLIFITLTRSEEGDDKRFLSRVILESLGANRPQKKEESGWLQKLKL